MQPDSRQAARMGTIQETRSGRNGTYLRGICRLNRNHKSLLQNHRSCRKRSQGTQRNRLFLRSLRSLAAILQEPHDLDLKLLVESGLRLRSRLRSESALKQTPSVTDFGLLVLGVIWESAIVSVALLRKYSQGYDLVALPAPTERHNEDRCLVMARRIARTTAGA